MTYKEALNAKVGEEVKLKGMFRTNKIMKIRKDGKIIKIVLDDGFENGWKYTFGINKEYKKRLVFISFYKSFQGRWCKCK